MSTDLVMAPRSGTVPANEWLLMAKQAEYLAQSDIIPVAYRRKPANIVVAALSGRTHGWDVLTSMRNGHVIEGVWGMKPEAMLALVIGAGHRVDIERIEGGELLDRGAIITGHREGQQPKVSRFLIRDGIEQGLVALKDGKLWARSSSGKRLPWELYPVDMCQWRAVGRVCRQQYGDITLGVYTVDELGAVVDQDGEVIEAEEVSYAPAGPVALSESVMAQFDNACRTEGIDRSDVLTRAFPDGVPDPLTDAHLPGLRDVFKVMVAERAGDITEAEIVADAANIVRDENQGDTGVRAIDPDSVRPATRTQVGKIKGEWGRLGVTDRDDQLARIHAFLGHDRAHPQSHNDLTTDEASAVIDWLVGLEP